MSCSKRCEGGVDDTRAQVDPTTHTRYLATLEHSLHLVFAQTNRALTNVNTGARFTTLRELSRLPTCIVQLPTVGRIDGAKVQAINGTVRGPPVTASSSDPVEERLLASRSQSCV